MAPLVALFPDNATGAPKSTPSILNWTVPVRLVAPTVTEATVAVKVTVWPDTDGLVEETTVVVVLPALTTTLLEVTPVRLEALKSMVMVAIVSCARLVKVARPLTVVTLSVPSKLPVPALRVAVTVLPLSVFTRLPNWSSMRITGCWANGAVTVAVADGWVWMANRVAGAALTTTLPEVAVVKPGAVKLIVIVLATVWKRLVKVAMPLTAVAVVVPCKVPAPAFRAAVTTVVLSELLKLPNWSSTRITGCWAKVTPAAAVVDGWV